MIIRISSRGNGAGLYKYLFHDSKGNDQIEFGAVHGTIADDPFEAMVEMDEIGRNTKGKNTISHIVIRPAQKYSLSMTEEEWLFSLHETMKAANLEGQPYAYVKHLKDNSWHLHAEVQRLDINTGTLRSDSYTAKKLIKARRHIEQTLGHDLTQEKSQHKPHFQKANFQAWQQARNGPEYIELMREQGYIISRNQTKDPWQAVYINAEKPQTYSVIKNLKDRKTETYITKKEVYERLSGISLPEDKEVIRDVRQMKINTQKVQDFRQNKTFKQRLDELRDEQHHTM